MYENDKEVIMDALKFNRPEVAANFALWAKKACWELEEGAAQRLRHDPAMRWIVGGKAASDAAASPSQMGRFETRWLTAEKNLSALADLSGKWIDSVHGRRVPGDLAEPPGTGVFSKEFIRLRGRCPIRLVWRVMISSKASRRGGRLRPPGPL